MGPERNGPTHGHVQGIQKIPGKKEEIEEGKNKRKEKKKKEKCNKVE